MVPLVEWMPRNAFGARYQAFALGWLTLGLLLLIVRQNFPTGKRWVPALLLLLPSAYWLQHSSAYTPPQYASTLFFIALMFFLVSQTISKQDNLRYIMGAAFIAGLATSNHLVAMPIMIATVIVLLFVKSSSAPLKRYLGLGLALLVGIAPFLWVNLFQPEAYQAVSETVPLHKAFTRLYTYVFSQTALGVMGINPTLFTDLELEVGWGSKLRPLLSVFYFSTLLLALVYRVVALFKQWHSERKIASDFIDIFLLSSFGVLAAFCVSSKGGHNQYRFLLAIVCCFPFLVAYVLNRLKPRSFGVVLKAATLLYVG